MDKPLKVIWRAATDLEPAWQREEAKAQFETIAGHGVAMQDPSFRDNFIENIDFDAQIPPAEPSRCEVELIMILEPTVARLGQRAVRIHKYVLNQMRPFMDALFKEAPEGSWGLELHVGDGILIRDEIFYSRGGASASS